MQNTNSFYCEYIKQNIYTQENIYAYAEKFYNERHIETFKLHFNSFVKQNLKKIEHPALFNRWSINFDVDAYKESLNKDTHKPL